MCIQLLFGINKMPKLISSGHICAFLHLFFITLVIMDVQANTLNMENKNLADIPSIPIDSTSYKTLRFGYNEIFMIPSGYFTEADMPDVEKIFLNDNNSEYISDNAFFELEQSLEEIHLQRNNLEKVTMLMFAGLFRLEKLYLNENYIHLIEPQSFLDLEKLKELQLNKNVLGNFTAETFDGFGEVYYSSIHLDDNGLNMIWPEAFLSTAKRGR